MVRVILNQTGKITTKSSVITAWLSITMAGLIIGYLLSVQVLVLTLKSQ